MMAARPREVLPIREVANTGGRRRGELGGALSSLKHHRKARQSKGVRRRSRDQIDV
jgi:hypothetical protein